MSTSLLLDMVIPGDPTGTALGIAFRLDDVEEVLRPGLKIVQQTMPTLAGKAAEILTEVDSAQNPLAASGVAFVKIDREVDEQLLGQGKLKVLDCDKRKIFALLAALGYAGSGRAREIRNTVLTILAKCGIPFRVEMEPKTGGSIQIHILDESLELKIVRPA